MNRISIFESDLSTNQVDTLDITDIVYVPGFSIQNLSAVGAAQVNMPTLCRTIEEFETAFGTQPATFKSAQYYPGDTGETADVAQGFSTNAIPGYGTTTDGGHLAPAWFAVGAPDPSYIYAKELITAGLPVVYERVNTSSDSSSDDYDVTVQKMYQAFRETVFNMANSLIAEKGEFDIKYITSGGYPTYEYTPTQSVANAMMALAAKRGDAVAIIDHTDSPERPLLSTNTNSVYYTLNHNAQGEPACPLNNINASFGTMFTPWGKFATVNSYDGLTSAPYMPGSFGYLVALASSIKTNANFLPVSGVARGTIPTLASLHTEKLLTNSIAESYQTPAATTVGCSINPITNIRPYGLTIWGNRTLAWSTGDGSKFATNFLNIRNMISDIKKQIYLEAKQLMFEPNTAELWLEFKTAMSGYLNDLVGGSGISGYNLIKKETVDKTKISAIVRIIPVYAVESFEITVEITDEDVSVQ